MNTLNNHIEETSNNTGLQVTRRDVTPHVDAPVITDESLLRKAYRFIPNESDQDQSYEARLAQRYDQKLYKEFAIADLSRYKAGMLGLRWRTEQEVVRGKGQFICGARGCEFADNTAMSSYEVLFEYEEEGKHKEALVKVRLCRECAIKLHHQKLMQLENEERTKKEKERRQSTNDRESNNEDKKKDKKEKKDKKDKRTRRNDIDENTPKKRRNRDDDRDGDRDNIDRGDSHSEKRRKEQ